jgi:hypothetical protein
MYCKIIVLLLLNGSNWELRDLNDFRAAAKTCKRRYNQCLAKFVKKGDDNYHAECKHPKKDNI